MADARIAESTLPSMTAQNADSRDLKGILMGDVAVLLKILPADAELDIEALKEEVVGKLKPICEINMVEIQEIGFGLKAVKVQVIVPDEEGKIDKVEAAISSVAGIRILGSHTW